MAKENGDRVLYTGTIPGLKPTYTKIAASVFRVIDEQHLDLTISVGSGTMNLVQNVSNDASQPNHWEERVNGP